MEFLKSVGLVFDFIFSIFENIVNGIYGTIDIIRSIIELIFNITKILPNPLYGTLYTFLTLFLVIFTYKIFRKGWFICCGI